MFLLNHTEGASLLQSLTVLLCRLLLSKVPYFKWLEDIVPNHIPHKFETQMIKKFTILPLPIQFKNESSYEQCVDIMDGYMDAIEPCYQKAFGTIVVNS